MMTERPDEREGRRSFLCSPLALGLYGVSRSRVLRSFLRRMVLKFEGGSVRSLTVRDILLRFHGVDVGLYSYGPCEGEPERFMAGTSIGRYCSIYWTARVVRGENALSSNSLIIEFALGESQGGAASPVKVTIGHDVFLGHNVIVQSSAERIGDGAFIGAGSVVHAPVPPFAVVTGNPARVVRYRFSEKKIQELLEEKWWLRSMDELSSRIGEFQKPLEGEVIR